MSARLATLLLPLVVIACGDAEPESDAEDGFVVEDGKVDDFLSLRAKEFVISGTGRVVVEAGQGEARAKKLVGYHHSAITWFLNQYLVDKEREGMHADANADYGGFSAMVKDGAYETVRLVQRNATTWDYDFEVIVAGKKTLMRDLPLNAAGEFTIEIGKPTNTELERDAEWYRKAPWDAWNPVNVPAYQKESVA